MSGKSESSRSASTKAKPAELPRLPFSARTGWRRWLKANHGQSTGVWVQFYRKDSGKRGLSYDEAVEEALCFGWIDSIARSLDSESHVQLFTPRKPKSPWSKSNKERVARLIDQGRMTPAGLEKIETAKRDGSWEALDLVEALEVPPDLKHALAANRKARENFEQFSPSKKKQVLYRIHSAKRPDTRSKRIELAVALAAENRSH